MPTRTARTAWTGTLEQGSGQVELSSSKIGTYDVSFPKRAADDAGGWTSPEELIAAAHSSCYAMQFSALAAHPGLFGGGFVFELSAAADPGRRWRVRVWLDGYLVEVVEAAVEVDAVLDEEGFGGLKNFVGARAALGLVDATRLELGAVPANADAVYVAFPGKVVQGGDFFGEDGRLAEGQDEDGCAEFDAFGDCRHMGQGHEGVEPGDAVEAAGGYNVVGDP